MTLFLKIGSSRKVANEDYNTTDNKNYNSNDNDNNTDKDTRDNKYKEYCCNKELKIEGKNVGTCTILTVWRKSLLVNCSGFTVIDCQGNLVFRVDNYSDRPSEIVLMDVSGKSLLTMHCHKTLRLVDDWLVYEGEASDEDNKSGHKKEPVCHVKKNMSILQTNSNILAHVFMGKSYHKRPPTFVIRGSYTQRSCQILETSSKKIVAEIKRKEAMNNGCASFGLDVFKLVVAPEFDVGFAMSLVLLLDQMYS